MIYQERLHLLSQQQHLQNTLANLPGDDFIMRMSTESRLHSIAQQLATAPMVTREPAKLLLTFAGAPVVASHGVAVEFGSQAVNAFSDAIAMMAASIAGVLKPTGRMPGKEQHQLLITDIARGSFGFQLEERIDEAQLPFEEVGNVELAIERTHALLSAAVIEDDDSLADAAAGLDQRAIEKVRQFMTLLIDHDAFCALSFRDSAFRFRDVEQVRRGLERIGTDNLIEESLMLDGLFQGVLSKPRTFQMDLGEHGVITGKVLKSVDDLDGINRECHYQQVRVRLQKTQVRHGKPRYVLMERPELIV